MLRIRILDLDGSLSPQAGLFADAAAGWVSARDWGPRIRLACDFGSFDRFRGWLDDAMPAGEPAVTFYGSGDFHHVTLALLARIRQPFNLLVLDKHPDWMRGIPFLHCGTWLRHALRSPYLRRAFLCGGETDFDNAYRWLAPWPEIAAGRVVVFPARRRFAGRGWAGVRLHPLLSEGVSPADTLQAALRPYLDELRRYPAVCVDRQGRADLAGRGGQLGLGPAAARACADGPRVLRDRRRGPARRSRCAGRLVARPAGELAQPPLHAPRSPEPADRSGRRRATQPPGQRRPAPRAFAPAAAVGSR